VSGNFINIDIIIAINIINVIIIGFEYFLMILISINKDY